MEEHELAIVTWVSEIAGRPIPTHVVMETVVVPGRDEAARSLATLSGIPCFTMGTHLVGKPLVVRVRCLYGSEMALGVVPTLSATDWRRSPVFVWKGGGEAP